ncbi:flagellar protein FlaG [Solibacillus sp. FSL K6-1523]|uniref:flagellar protein FlaG n=1 Tax=Solibacillus sp. FSL K6-1523 TaxID=2921471 RepID=UPI0030FC40EE
MRISSQQIESPMKAQVSPPIQETIGNKTTEAIKVQNKETTQQVAVVRAENVENSPKKEKVQEAVSTLNEFLHINNYSSKFVLHEGLDKYYVKLIDPETEEVIKEIPAEALLNSFYEMQKLAGVIVDEKV